MARLGLVDKERSANSKLLRDYPGHESLWCYRRFVCQARLVTAPSSVAGPTAAAGRQSEEPPPSSSDNDRRGLYDWEAWGRAVTEWHDGCVREDDKAAAVEDSDEDSEEEHEDTTATEEADFEEAEGALPGAPSGGGLLATFLGQEARFALKCATDKVWVDGVVVLGVWCVAALKTAVDKLLLLYVWNLVAVTECDVDREHGMLLCALEIVCSWCMSHLGRLRHCDQFGIPQ